MLMFRARFELLSQYSKGESDKHFNFAAIVKSVKLFVKLNFQL
jgi:hypothetical protein